MRRKSSVLTHSAVGLFAVLPVASAQSEWPVDAEGHQWWQHAVFQEIYPRSYMDSNNDGIGDLNGIASKMEYLKWLGVDAIWIAPCFPSPQVDFGYDVSDYEEHRSHVRHDGRLHRDGEDGEGEQHRHRV